MEPKVTCGQELIVTSLSAIIEPMVTDEWQLGFSARLNRALDEYGIPPKGEGRQTAVAKMFGVSQKGARKWLEAEPVPKTTRVGHIAARLNVNGEWLLTGRGPMRAVHDSAIMDPPNSYQAAPAEQNPYIDPAMLTMILNGIERRWGDLPEPNEELADIISQLYMRLTIATRDEGRDRIKSILSQSISKEWKRHKGVAGAGERTRDTNNG